MQSISIVSFLPLILILSVIAFLFYYRKIRRENRERLGIARPAMPVFKVPDDQTRKNPGTAAVLSFIFPGLGHIYIGHFREAWKYMLVDLFGWFLFLGGIFSRDGQPLIIMGAFFMLAAWITGIRNAYKSTVEINKALDSRMQANMKKCPYCAEMIKAEAILCRYCNKELKPPD